MIAAALVVVVPLSVLALLAFTTSVFGFLVLISSHK
jgi:hypothetical protein